MWSRWLSDQTLDSNNRTLIPLRFSAEEMGATVDWDGATRTVYIWTAGSGSGSKTTALTEADIKEAKELSDWLLASVPEADASSFPRLDLVFKGNPSDSRYYE